MRQGRRLFGDPDNLERQDALEQKIRRNRDPAVGFLTIRGSGRPIVRAGQGSVASEVRDMGMRGSVSGIVMASGSMLSERTFVDCRRPKLPLDFEQPIVFCEPLAAGQ